jgi:membrane-associated phospholipid phosphatase
MSTVSDWEFVLSHLVQGLGLWLKTPMQWLSFSGSVEFYLLFMPAVYWCWNAWLGLELGLMLILSAGLNEILKLTFRRPRPYWVPGNDVEFLAAEGEESFAFPSGHAQNAGSLWGLLTARLPRPSHLRDSLIGLLILLVGVSRVFLGVHAAGDVVAGWAVGLALLWVYLRCRNGAAARLAGMNSMHRASLILLSSLLLLVSAVIARSARGAPWLLRSWEETALQTSGTPIDPLQLDNSVDLAGLLLGLGLGASWLWERGWLRSDGTLSRRIARYAVGFAGLILVWMGLRALVPAQPGLFRYSRITCPQYSQEIWSMPRRTRCVMGPLQTGQRVGAWRTLSTSSWSTSTVRSLSSSPALACPIHACHFMQSWPSR